MSSLPTRPTAPSAFGGSGYTATEMKAAFDRLPLKIIERFNLLLSEIENGTLTEEICAHEPLSTLISDVKLIKARLGL